MFILKPTKKVFFCNKIYCIENLYDEYYMEKPVQNNAYN